MFRPEGGLLLFSVQCKKVAMDESQRLFRTTQNDTITAVGSGDGKSGLFTGFQLFQAFLSLVSSAYT